MPRRKLYPMPVEGLFSNPSYIVLPAAGRGMLFSLCEHFWRSECQPRPRDDDQLFAIARAPRPTWRHHRANILAVFDAWAPEAARHFETRQSRRDSLRIASDCSRAARRRKAATARLDGTANLNARSTDPVAHGIWPAPRRQACRAASPDVREEPAAKVWHDGLGCGTNSNASHKPPDRIARRTRRSGHLLCARRESAGALGPRPVGVGASLVPPPRKIRVAQ